MQENVDTLKREERIKKLTSMPRLLGIDGLIYCRPAASILALAFSLVIGLRAWKKYLNKDISVVEEQ